MYPFLSGVTTAEDWVEVVADKGRPGTTDAAATAAAGKTGVGTATGNGAPGAGAAKISGTGTAPGDTIPIAAAGTTPGMLTPVTTPPTGGA